MIAKTIAQYKIVGHISSYGMGVVYKAVDTVLNRTVALKILPSQLMNNPSLKDRFIQEAQTAGALDHPNICTIHEFGESEDGQLFIVMPYYQGETLQERIERGPIPVRELILIATQIADGLKTAHDAGIIHRDIKPANIMITGQNIVKILDFGLAKQVRQFISRSGDIVGTAAYMSPEQAMGEKVDRRTDIFSFGMILYEMLAGEHPFVRDHEHAVIYAIINEEPDFNPEHFPEIPQQFLNIVRKMLAKQPEKRYERVDAAYEEFQALMKEMKIRQGESLTPLNQILQRNAGAIAMGLVILLMIFGLYNSELVRYGRTGNMAEVYNIENPTIAVLPLTNLSRDATHTYLVDGLTEQLITDLARINSLRVISRTSVMRYKNTEKSIPEIATELKADYIVEGSVIRDQNRVRVTAQLIHTGSDQHVWADSYDREVLDVLDLQQEIALAVADEIHINLTARDKNRLNTPGTANPEAYDAYLLGRYAMNRFTVDGWQQAIGNFEKALSLDPEYAPAYVELASAYFFLTVFGLIPAEEGQAKITMALDKALDIDPNNGMAHMMLGLKYQFFDLDWAGAEEAMRKALRINPGLSDIHREYGWLMGRTGRLDEALFSMKKALELDPYSVQSFHSLSQIYYYRRNYGEAIKYAELTKSIEPNSAFAYDDLGWACAAESRYDEAIRAFETKAVLLGQTISADIGYVYAVMGRHDKALNIAEQLKTEVPRGRSTFHEIGRIYLGLGELETALDYFEQSVDRNESFTVMMKVNPLMDAVRDHSRYRKLLSRIGLLQVQA